MISNLSWLGKLNYYFLQFFYIRLARVMDGEKVIRYKLLEGIFPMSGWNNDYIYMKTKKDRILMNISRLLFSIAVVFTLIFVICLINPDVRAFFGFYVPNK